MKSRLVVAALLPRDVVARARDEFDAVVVVGSDDMTAPETVDAAARHRADAILFTNTLPLTAEAIDNFAMGFQRGAPISRRGLLDPAAMAKRARELIAGFNIRISSERARASSLSGGNLQKLVVARELSHGSRDRAMQSVLCSFTDCARRPQARGALGSSPYSVLNSRVLCTEVRKMPEKRLK